MKYMLTLLIVYMLFIGLSCKSPTGPTNNGIALSIEDVSCTEAWLNLDAGSLPLPANVVVNKNENNSLSFTLTNRDTTLYDSTLIPNQTYTYQIMYGNNKSRTVTAKTLDTTSSNFTWQTYILGDGNSSAIHDVALVNDTLAYAVGAIYYKDSTGQFDLTPYNLVIWNGNQWSIKHIPFNLYNYNCSIAGSYLGKASTIYPFGHESIITDGTDFVRLVGISSSHYPCAINILKGSIQKIWGKSISDFYSVGTNGTIIHFLNSNWQKVESGTTLNITDIYGSPSSSDVYASLYNTSSSLVGHDLLKITGNNEVERLPTPGNLYEASSIWADNKDKLFIAGSGLFRKAYGNWKEINEFKMKSLTGVRANGLNDIFVIGIMLKLESYF